MMTRLHENEDAAWERMVEAFRSSAPSGGAPAWLEQKVMSEIEALPERGLVTKALEWLLSPVPLRVSPLAGGLVAAALTLVIVLSNGDDSNPPLNGAPEAVVYVQFMLEAPTATSVSVAGDFSDWEPTFSLVDADGDGVWSGRVPVQPGVHSYMFLINGTEWAPDPNADHYQDDGFGNRNSVLAVAAG